MDDVYEEFARQLLATDDPILDLVLAEVGLLRPEKPPVIALVGEDPRFSPIVQICFARARADNASWITSARMLDALAETHPQALCRALGATAEEWKKFRTRLRYRLQPE